MMHGERDINLNGLYICAAVSSVMLILKLSVIDTWSWWRVMLPVGLFVGFHVTHIVVAFIYLSFAQIPERPHEAEVLEPHTVNAHYIAAMLFFVVFGDNVVLRPTLFSPLHADLFEVRYRSLSHALSGRTIPVKSVGRRCYSMRGLVSQGCRGSVGSAG